MGYIHAHVKGQTLYSSSQLREISSLKSNELGSESSRTSTKHNRNLAYLNSNSTLHYFKNHYTPSHCILGHFELLRIMRLNLLPSVRGVCFIGYAGLYTGFINRRGECLRSITHMIHGFNQSGNPSQVS